MTEDSGHLVQEPFDRIQPAITDRTRPFWTGGRAGSLLIQRCLECRLYVHPPTSVCPRCRQPSLTPEPVSGQGAIYSCTISRYQWVSTVPIPYVVVEVELDEQAGLLVTSNLLCDEPASIRIGDRVHVVFAQHGEAYIPLFRTLKVEEQT